VLQKREKDTQILCAYMFFLTTFSYTVAFKSSVSNKLCQLDGQIIIWLVATVSSFLLMLCSNQLDAMSQVQVLSLLLPILSF